MQHIETIPTSLLSAQKRIQGHLGKLGENPPQVLILEGGTYAERKAISLFWAARLNCTNGNLPCVECVECQQIFEGVHRDLIFLDGHEGSLKIDQIRAVRGQIGEKPRGNGYRVVILAEAQALTIEAANALLKSLEDPNPSTRFVMTAPQRERLLPTLVSRGWVLTLSWGLGACSGQEGDDCQLLDEWVNAFTLFLRTGKGWMARTSAKGAVTKNIADQFLLRCQQNLVDVLVGRPNTELAALLAERLDPARLRQFDVAIAQSQEAINAQGNPAVVLDWLATRTHMWANMR